LPLQVYGPVNDLVKRSRFFPEFEYIVCVAPQPMQQERWQQRPSHAACRYDSSGAFIEPHVDNHSVITGIIMLSDRDGGFEGGVNCFEPNRQYALQRGDCVLFRGEKTQHWITPVTAGVRRILQWEFSRI
jgi:alkylated DNA repair dioxygenase AlkB